jgi:hypothetical protein
MPMELPDGWRDELPDEIKTNGALNEVTTIDQMATMIVNGRKLQANQISIPGEDAPVERRQEFLKDLQTKIPELVYVGEGVDMTTVFDRMGRPKDPTEYQIGDIPDPLKENFSTLKAKAHEAGLTDAQMKAISSTILEDFNNSAAAEAAAAEAERQKIKAEWGEAAADKQKAAADFAKRLGFNENFAEAIEEGVLGVDNLKAFEKMMSGFESPGPRIGGEPGGTGSDRLTPGEAELKLEEIMGNRNHPYWDNTNIAHKAAIDKVLDLTRMAEAGKEKTEVEKFREALAGNG